MRSSEPDLTRPRPTAPTTRPIVLEGIPGAGKTTLLNLLADHGYAVLGEYIDDQAATIPLDGHPARDDDVGHLTNWIRKDIHASNFATSGPLVLDRNWLTALAWAYSCPDTAGPHQLERRTRWAARNLEYHLLQIPEAWIVLNCSACTSLDRRRERLDPAHPWADPVVLERLRTFYADPAAIISTVNSMLADAVGEAAVVHINAEQPLDDVVHQVSEAMP